MFFKFLLLMSMLVFSHIGLSATSLSEYTVEDEAQSEAMLCRYMSDPLWSKMNAYDATHLLMIPLEYAFKNNKSVIKKCFSDYFLKLQKVPILELERLGVLTWLQHLHLASRYAVLSNDNALADWLTVQFKALWRENDAWLWGREPFTGIAERINWKLNTRREEVSRSYYRVIFDEDYFALSLGIDLYGINVRNETLEQCPECQEAKSLFLRVFNERLTWIGNRWLIDVGLWQSHPDFAFSGYFIEPVDNNGELLQPETSVQVVIDSSHAHRYPSWLRSAELALDSDEKEYINKLQEGLRVQFKEYILSNSSLDGLPLLNNFMDGGNGYFRYNYSTHSGFRKGYSPYGLSGTLAFGWWAMLGGKEISKVYSDLHDSFPLSSAQHHVYGDPSTRKRHSIVSDRFDNSLIYAISLMASELSLDFSGASTE